MEEKVFIMTSSNENMPNWSGKEFTTNPAKIFTSIFPLIEDLKSWLYRNKDNNNKITIEPLNNKEMAEKIIKNEAFLRIT